MVIYTDVPQYGRSLLPDGTTPVFTPCGEPDAIARPLVAAFFGEGASVHRARLDDPLWSQLLVTGFARSSQYERLIHLVRQGTPVPHGVVCVARSGGAFQGFRGRSWTGCPGNLHLSVHLAPEQPIARFETVFLALAAVSVVDVIDRVTGLDGVARIKWVNDVLVHSAKVAGVLAYTQSRGATVTSVVLGIGLNVETTPAVAPTPFVPAAGSLREFAADPAAVSLREVLHGLLCALARNYRLLLTEGYRPLVERYRARSAVLGEEVRISSDDADEVPRVLAAGRVVGIGDGLELRLAGRAEPVIRGRLILGADLPEAPASSPIRLREAAAHPAGA